MNYHSAIKRNGVPTQEAAQMHLENTSWVKEPDTKGHLLYDYVYIKYPR